MWQAWMDRLRGWFRRGQIVRGGTLRIPKVAVEAAMGPLADMVEHLDAVLALDLSIFRKHRRLPAAFFEHMAQAQQAYDRYLATIIETSPLAVTCSKGCTACCHDIPTVVRGAELVMIYRQYHRFEDFHERHNHAWTLGQRFNEDVEAVAPGQTSLDASSKAFRNAQLRYRLRREPCVFLNDAGHCRIYDVRPIPCRMHFSLSAPAWCWADDPNAGKAQTPNLAPPELVVDLLQEIDRALGLTDLTPTLFHGLAQFGRRVMDGQPLLTVEDYEASLRGGRTRGKKRRSLKK